MTGADTRQTAPAGPVTYWEASSACSDSLTAAERHNELSHREQLARGYAKLRASGTYDPARHGAGDTEPLTVAEHLELLATGAVAAHYYRHPADVHHAALAGASWEQIAEALDITAEQARAGYRDWAEGQHRLWRDYQGRCGGLDDAEHAAAIARSGPAAAEVAGGDEDQAVVILAALDEAATLIRRQAALCLVCETHPAELCEEHADMLRRADAYDALASGMGGAR